MKHFLQGFEDLLGRDLLQAVQMLQWAFAFEARRAGKVESDDFGFVV